MRLAQKSTIFKTSRLILRTKTATSEKVNILGEKLHQLQSAKLHKLRTEFGRTSLLVHHFLVHPSTGEAMPKFEWSQRKRREHSQTCKNSKRLTLEQKMRILLTLHNPCPPSQVGSACPCTHLIATHLLTRDCPSCGHRRMWPGHTARRA